VELIVELLTADYQLFDETEEWEFIEKIQTTADETREMFRLSRIEGTFNCFGSGSE
jgi:hypothetical protein